MTRYLLSVLLLCIAFALNAQTPEDMAVVDTVEVGEATIDVTDVHNQAAYDVVAGKWQYSKPYVHADGSTFLGRVGKPIAKSKIKKKLNKAYKKLKLKNRWDYLALNDDGTWQMSILGVTTRGKYSYNPEEETLTLKWNGIPLKSHTHRDGDKLYIAFDVDRLLIVLRLIGGLSHSESLNMISALSKNYDNVLLGFEMKRVR